MSWLPCYGCLSQLSCPSCHVLAILFTRSCPSWLVQTDLSGRPVQSDMSRLYFPSCSVPDVLSRLAVLPWLSCLGCPVPAVPFCNFWPSCRPFPVMAVLPRLSWPDCPLQLSCPGCPFRPILSRVSCLITLFSAQLSWVFVVSWLSYRAIRLVLAVLFRRPCPFCSARLTFQADLSRLTCPGRRVPDVVSRMSCHGCPATIFCLICPVFPVCSGHPVHSVLSKLTSPFQADLSGQPVQTDLSGLYFPSCPVPDVLSRLHCRKSRPIFRDIRGSVDDL